MIYVNLVIINQIIVFNVKKADKILHFAYAKKGMKTVYLLLIVKNFYILFLL